MKNQFLLIFSLFFITNAFAQIQVIHNITIKNTQVKNYDSLQSLNKDNFLKHTGQTIFLRGSDEEKKKGGYYHFYIAPTFSLTKDDVYKRSPYDEYKATYESVSQKYFYINKIIKNPDLDKPISSEDYCLQLVELLSKDTLYYTVDKYGSNLIHFTTLGYFEKQKNTYIGKKYIITDRFIKHIDSTSKYECFNDVNTGKLYSSFPVGTTFECIDIILEEGLCGFLCAKMKNNTYGTFIVYLGQIDNNNICEVEQYNKYKALLINKYGSYYANLILKEKIILGMTAQMCRESWGEPQTINRSTGTYGVHEQWVYGESNYVYFEKGKITSIQN